MRGSIRRCEMHEMRRFAAGGQVLPLVCVPKHKVGARMECANLTYAKLFRLSPCGESLDPITLRRRRLGEPHLEVRSSRFWQFCITAATMARAATALIATCLLCLAALVDAQTCELWAGT